MSGAETNQAPLRWGRALALVALGCLLLAPSLTVGFTADDHVIRVKQDPASDLGGFEYAPWGLFSFFSGAPEQREAALESGVISWWTAEGLQLHFFRPLSTITHHIDHALWPDNAVLHYAHSIAWFALLAVALAVLYRRLPAAGVAGAATLAVAVFALDDAHGPTVGFIANRNSVIAAFFGVVCLWAHDRAVRDAWKPGRILAPLALVASLYSAEAGVATLGYLAAYTVFVQPGGLRHRALSLAPFAVAFVTWLVPYKLGGYGSHGSGVYLDPVGEMGPFALAAVERVPPLMLAQLGFPWSDFWVALPKGVAAAVWGTALVSVVLWGIVLTPLLRARPALRFWTGGAVLSCVPIAATVPADRLLMLVGLGAAPVAAALILAGRHPDAEWPAWRRRLTRVVGWSMVAVHLVLAPLLLPIRARSMETIQSSMALIDAAVPFDPVVNEETLVIVMAPSDGLVSFMPIRRESLGQPRPAHVRLLATTSGGSTVTRVDANTLHISADVGLLTTGSERILRTLDEPFHVGDIVDLGDVAVEVTSVQEDRPFSIDVRFAEGLDAPHLRFITWRGSAFEPFELPAIGESVELPPVDYLATAAAVVGIPEESDETEEGEGAAER